MPRSPADATRFTPTGPHATAFSRPASSTTSSSSSSGASSSLLTGSGEPIAGETPQQRVARLRAAAHRAKHDQITLMDKLYVHGRVWADRARRVFAIGLIGATVVIGGVTVFTFTDMIMHNRRLKREFAAEAARIKALPPPDRQAAEKTALIAAGGGPAAAAMTPEERAAGRGVVANLKDWALAGLTPAGDEYKSRWNKEGGEAVVIDGPQTAHLPTLEGRAAERDVLVTEPGKVEMRVQEKKQKDLVEGPVQGRGMMASVLSWFGR